jgi:predicted DNA-binding antitoxin AbrB/MazE fold protein
MKKFTIYLKEAEEVKIDTKLKDELLEMVKKSLNTSDSKTANDFIEAFKADSEKNQIEGLINDSDVYDFYLKFMDEIDEILSEANFFDKNPKELNTFSLYNYLVVGTKNAVKIAIDGIKETK